MNNKRTILVVEDENNISKFIAAILKANDYSVISAVSGGDALTMLNCHMPDLVLLDLGLPDIDGIKLIGDIRSWSNIPIIVVSARGHEHDKIEALDMGADDYITKPFSTGELLARIRTSLRHKRMSVDDELWRTKQYSCGGLKIDFSKYCTTVDGKEVHLTNIEFKIIELLCKYAGKVLTYDYILKEIWGPLSCGDNKTLRVNMANLRRKIEKNPADPEYLFTEPGVGYRMAEAD